MSDRNAQLLAELALLKQRLEQETARCRQAEASARQSRLILDGSADAVFLVDSASQRFADVNQTACKRLGYSREELLAMGPADINPHQAPAEIDAMIKRWAASVDTTWTLEGVHRRRDGTTFPVELHIHLIKQDGWQMFVTVARDITARKQAEQDMLRQLQLAETYFSHSVSCLVILDRDYNFIRVNQAYARACQRDIGDFTGRNHFDMYPSDAKLIFDDVVRNKRPFETFTRAFSFPDQPERGITYWDWTLAPILDQQGEVEYLVFSLNEVTERKRAEEQQLAKERELRESLVREVHHRIKNNLQGVVGLLRQYASEQPQIAPLVDDIVGKIHSVAIVHGLQSSDAKEEIQLGDLLNEIIRAVSAIMGDGCKPGMAGETCIVHLDRNEAVPIAIVLNELIVNACKHSPQSPTPGQVEVSLSRSDQGVLIRISNQRMFPRKNFDFSAGANLGIGLTLVGSLLPRHGATLSYHEEGDVLVTELQLASPVVL